jgi:spore coat protein CotF
VISRHIKAALHMQFAQHKQVVSWSMTGGCYH